MSIALMSIVWKLDLPPGEKLVLLSLADQANDDGRQCWPSVETIAERSGQGIRTVRRALSSLEEKGHLTRKHREGTSTQYHVHPCQNGTPAKSAPLPKTTMTPANLAPKPSRTTNTSIKRALPANWWPEDFGEGTESSAIVAGWDEKTLRRHVEQFAAHHSAVGSKYTNWQAAWSKWVLNTEKFKPRPPPETRGGSLADIGDEVRRLYGI